MKNNNWEKEFNKDYCNSYAGDSGLGGNDPQDPVDEWACYPNDVRKFIRSLLMQQKQELLAEFREMILEYKETHYKNTNPGKFFTGETIVTIIDGFITKLYELEKKV